MNVTVDSSHVRKLPDDIARAARAAFLPTAEAGVPLLQAEIPQRSGQLRAGVKVQPQGDTEAGYEVSAESAEGFDYAEAIATGRKAFSAKKGHALRIPVASLNGRVPLKARDGYIFVKSVKAAPPNPYPDRAVERMEQDLPEHFAVEVEARL